MRIKSGRPSPAMLVAVIALVVALTGGAYAATKIGTQQLKRGAVTTKKLKKAAVTRPKIARGAVNTARLDPTARSEGFVTNVPGQTPLTAATSTTVATLNLAAGAAYVVTASVSLGNDGGGQNLVSCSLRDDGVVVSSGNGTLPAQAVFGETIALTGTSNGGAMTLDCQPEKGAQARNAVITAVRVASLETQP